MSDYLAELESTLAADPNAVIRADDLLRALRPVAQALEEVARHRDTLVETVAFVNQLQERLMIVDALPANAPLGSLLRLREGTVAQRLPLYLGNGPDQPITKLTPVVV